MICALTSHRDASYLSQKEKEAFFTRLDLIKFSSTTLYPDFRIKRLRTRAISLETRRTSRKNIIILGKRESRHETGLNI